MVAEFKFQNNLGWATQALSLLLLLKGKVSPTQ